MTALAELTAQLGRMDVTEKAALLKEIQKDPIIGGAWVPSPGPQLRAYDCKADVLLYGGQAGGGKTAILSGLALTQHTLSLLMRRQYTDLGSLIEDLLDKHGTRDGFSGSAPARLRFKRGKRECQIDFGAAKIPGDEQSWKGRAHDFLGIDEVSQWLESQVRFLMGWVRSIDPKQHCRVVLATNPPEKPGEGQWLMDMFGPWLNKAHPLYPTKSGVLRWCISDEEGKDKWVDGSGEYEIGGKMVKAESRTFIPAALDDNPFLRDTGYAAKLDSLPEPLRSAVRDGNWMISHEDDPFQIIPTNWILAAQERWTRDPPKEAPMCSMGVDVAQGGSAKTVIQCRYDYWYAMPVSVPGVETPLGSDVAALVVKHRRNKAAVIIDMGGGYGGGPLERLQENLETGGLKAVHGFNGSKASSARTKDRQLGFYNLRAEKWWGLREDLDPDQEGGSVVMLPPDGELASDLMSARWELTTRGIKVEDKKDMIKRLGHSPDKGDALVMSRSAGPTYMTHGQVWREHVKTVRIPKAVHGYENRKRRRR